MCWERREHKDWETELALYFCIEQMSFIINSGVLHALIRSEETLRKKTKYSNLLVAVSKPVSFLILKIAQGLKNSSFTLVGEGKLSQSYPCSSQCSLFWLSNQTILRRKKKKKREEKKGNGVICIICIVCLFGVCWSFWRWTTVSFHQGFL